MKKTCCYCHLLDGLKVQEGPLTFSTPELTAAVKAAIIESFQRPRTEPMNSSVVVPITTTNTRKRKVA